MAWSALAFGVALAFVNLISLGDAQTVSTSPPSSIPTAVVAAEPPAGSLGVRYDEIRDRWNALDQPPLITNGLPVTPEAGSFDSFLYRFGPSSLVAGAYDPSDGYVYGLLVRSSLGDEFFSNMYIHICYLIDPGGQDCFDTFLDETGRFGKSAEDLADVDTSSDWGFDGAQWQVTVEDNVETIRVLGEDALGASLPG